MSTFFYKYWGLYYLLFFLLLGLLVYALLWRPNLSRYHATVAELKNRLEVCQSNSEKLDSTLNAYREGTNNNNVVYCNATVRSGGQGVTTTQHELGNQSGIVNIDYNMMLIPDEIEVYHNNVLVAHSDGLVKGTGRLQFRYSVLGGQPSYCTVIISAPGNDTQWEYLLNCPQ